MAAGYRFSRRWLLVTAGTVGLIGLGTADEILPAGSADDIDAAALRALILAGARSYVGYAESSGRLGLPELPQLESATALFTGTTRIRAFVHGPDRFRVDELTPVGERDTYRIDGREYVWDFGFDQLTEVVGATPLRLPRAADLLPPELARRLLALAPDDPVTPLPARRIAGRTAAGLRLVPTDPATTVGRVDVWADPATGLPLRVEVGARGEPAGTVALLATELREVTERSPDPTELVPTVPQEPDSSRPAPRTSAGRCGYSMHRHHRDGWPGGTGCRCPAPPTRTCRASGSTASDWPGSRSSR
ncbi:MAG: hypothetical protein ACRDRH_22335 [Pseudonocardia sp.]